ncbi:hypothetical protein BH10ACT4_BH10ACT4_13670 [soil metagenome]
MQSVSDSVDESELSNALERGEIVAYFQPQIDLATGEVVAVETLSRWIHPLRGIIGPSQFIPLAERTGQIHQIGALMMEEGFGCAAEWQARGHPLEVSINVSAAQLSTSRFFDRVMSSLDRLTVAPERLTLEITESQPIHEMGVVREQLDVLRERGICISIDDFGCGHSSIERVLGLGATELKVDRTLIHAGTDSARSALAAVISLVHGQHIRVVAEGVETADHLEFSRQLGCDRAQGFLFASATPGIDLERRIRANRAADWVTNPGNHRVLSSSSPNSLSPRAVFASGSGSPAESPPTSS